MKRFLILISLIVFVSVTNICGSSNKSKASNIPQSLKLRFFNTDPLHTTYDKSPQNVEYSAKRIGEYYWMDSNFNHYIPPRYVQWNNPQTTKDQQVGSHGWIIGEESMSADVLTHNHLDKYLPTILIDPSEYQIDIDDFKKYYGIHYSRMSCNYLSSYGKMYENDELNTEWGIPTNDDFKQLFAMCNVNLPDGILREQDVRFDLSTKNMENPLAFNFHNKENPNYQVYWFTGYNTNRYGFNLMPAGARLNGDSYWCNGLGPNNGCWNGSKGDIYHLFYTAKFATRSSRESTEIDGSVDLHDWIDFKERGWHWLNVRWCRRLTDEELGYKLYINSSQTDIIKTGINDPAPTGYSELPNGYLRGFYVQYILDNPNPDKTVAELVAMSKNTDYFHKNKIVDSSTLSMDNTKDEPKEKFIIYPNPVINTLHIESEENIVNVEIYNSNGTKVKSYFNIDYSVDVESLQAGIYILKIQSKSESTTFKIQKK